VELDRFHALQWDPVILPGARQDFEERGGQIVQVTQAVERLVVAGARHGRPLLLQACEQTGGVGDLSLPKQACCLDVLAQVRRDFLVQELGKPAIGIKLLPRLLRPDQLPEKGDGYHRVRVLLAQGIQLSFGTLQLPRKTQELAQEGAHAAVYRMAFDVIQSRRQRLPQIARPVMVVCIHVLYTFPRRKRCVLD